MKAISASIIVLAGAFVFGLGALSRGDAQTVCFFFGGFVTVMGLWGWFTLHVRNE